MIERIYYRVKLNTDQIIYSQLIDIVQDTGTSTTKVMSQNAVTTAINTALESGGAELEAKLNENIIKDPSKTYLVWKGDKFPNSTEATFKAPEGCTIDWGDGNVETFETTSTAVNTHTYTDGFEYHLISLSNYTAFSNAFFNCRGLTSVTIGNSVTSIGSNAFSGCSSLTSVTIPDNVTSIGSDAFFGCSGLTSVTIPNSVTSIAGSAFYGCSRLTSITIPDSVTSIGIVAFKGCSRLRTIRISAINPPTLYSDTFSETSIEKIIVPKSAINTYKTAEGWSTYADKIVYEVDSSDLDAVVTNLENGTDSVLIQTTDTNHSFKVMTDGRAKVQTAPQDNDDVVRKLELDTKQATLVSGTNIKTINGNSLLGSGDLTIAGSDDKLDKQTAQTDSDQIYGKLADGSQTMFDVTMGATATTIPRRDTAGRIQVADGVSGNDAVNFNQLSAVEASVINSLDKEHIAYVNKENTFTEPQTLSYVDSFDPNLSEYGEIGGSGANYSYTEYTDDTHKYHTSGEAYIDSFVGRVMVGRSTSDEKGVSENSIVLDVRKNWIARTELTRERIDGELSTPVQTYYAYKFPKTYPNKEVTLATIEDLTAQLDTKFDKAGGTVTGNMVVGGNFTVQGKTTTVDSETLRVTDKLIEVGKGNTAPLTSPAGLITPKYDGTNNGGIVYDHTGTAYVGDISLDSNGNVDVNNSDLQPIATRNATITNGNLVKWDGTNHKLIDAGKNVENLVDKLPASLRSQAYVRNANGEDTGLAYTYTDEGGTLAVRNANGQLQVSNPSQDKDAANKSYADNLTARYVSTSILGG